MSLNGGEKVEIVENLKLQGHSNLTLIKNTTKNNNYH